MRITGWSVHFGDVATPVQVRVRDGAAESEERAIEYLPHGAPVPGYRFELP
jgi:hypothetical protein